MTEIDERVFRDVSGCFATGVVVVTALTSEGPVGFTCQSFQSLSLDPPLISFNAVAMGASWTRLRESSVVGLSVLGAHQEAVATQFATSGVDKFAGVAVEAAANGAPLIVGALAHLEATFTSVVRHGDHDLAVLAVTRAVAFGGEPTLYFRGAFRRLEAAPPARYAE